MPIEIGPCVRFFFYFFFCKAFAECHRTRKQLLVSSGLSRVPLLLNPLLLLLLLLVLLLPSRLYLTNPIFRKIKKKRKRATFQRSMNYRQETTLKCPICGLINISYTWLFFDTSNISIYIRTFILKFRENFSSFTFKLYSWYITISIECTYL